jgi:hypothetical protein
MRVPEYCVLDLANRQLIVHRKPVADASAPLAHVYDDVSVVGEDGVISPLEAPTAALRVADMLPPAQPAKS